MKKTLLLCFIHGFKGDESTFGKNYAFVEHFRKLLAASLPKLDVKAVVYPTYETRGDLGECVTRFGDWLLNKVIDLEVIAGTPSPTVDPSVRVVLVGHSMGGIVAAETAIRTASEQPIHNSVDEDSPTKSSTAMPPPPNALMFPYIQGVLAFDTPFLGISPGVVAHGAESHYAAASAAISQLSGLASLWGGAKAAKANNPNAKTAGALPPAASSPGTRDGNRDKQDHSSKPAAAGGNSGWGKWGTIAMAAGAVGAVAAGGAAAYLNRDQITQGLGWATSHLEFVGCLARKEELKRRVAYMVRLNKELGVGFGNLYTRLGQGAGSKQVGMVGTVLGSERTFCVVPQRDQAGDWRQAVNNKAKDEIGAHVSMFEPTENPGFDKMANDARDMVAAWFRNDWYESSSADTSHSRR
ncbi:hypothetical protein C7999DRAFT_27444 [Corynascus novoguineensis]|uniref:AB hydrolase-1 domain-containing protein n=1 Tax=Corynascus novoguineensis TaxID=1126955 RepID=A0AAN7HJ67_9PEZI|nr:hypothetical protein C7999DRAFT_27444 [Corynascus novoguineensis]